MDSVLFQSVRGSVLWRLTTALVTAGLMPLFCCGAILSAGKLNSVVVTKEGNVWAWGHNGFGESGPASVSASSSITNPVMMSPSITNATAVSTSCANQSVGHTLVLTADGTVFASGDNEYGQLGDGTTNNHVNLTALSSIDHIVTVAAGGTHSVALRGDGTVWSWGNNLNGNVGIGNTNSPQKVPVLINNLTNIVQIAAGSGHSMALEGNGQVWSWGLNSFGEVGNGTIATPQKNPVKVITTGKVVAIAAGGHHSLALNSDGTVLIWGESPSGSAQVRPVPVNGLSNIVAICTGFYHSLAIAADGTVWAWGLNTYGEIGDGTSANTRAIPVKVNNITHAVAIAAGEYHSLALLDDGTIVGWGYSHFGQVGNGAKIGSAGDVNKQPVPLYKFGGVYPVANMHSLLTKTDGTVWAFGANGFGQLGDGTFVNRRLPVQTKAWDVFLTCSAGGTHSLALAPDGRVYGWGCNLFGQLTDSRDTQDPIPSYLSSVGHAVQVAAGQSHSLALQSNGTVLAWGQNSFGQLGDTTYTNRWTPVTVTNLSNVQQVAAGAYHCLAVLGDGTIKTWGQNLCGQLGDGTVINHATPVTVALANAAAISAGYDHSLALLSTGTVWAWGNNWCGQLGNGTTTNSQTPVQVTALTNIAAISAGAKFSAALASNGIVWAWGYNGYGQFGNGTTQNSSSPVLLPGITNAIAIKTGDNNLLVTFADGTVQAAGANGSGQAGAGIRPFEAQLTSIENFRINTPKYQSSSATALAHDGIFSRGGKSTNGLIDVENLSDLSLASIVVPQDYQKGVSFMSAFGNAGAFFPTNLWTTTFYHYNDAAPATPLEFKTPIAAFGSFCGGTPLYTHQTYEFAVHICSRSTNTTPATFRIAVFNRGDFSFVTNIDIPIPPLQASGNGTPDYDYFSLHGLTNEAFGLQTIVSREPAWAVTAPYFGGAYETYFLRHTAHNPNYVYEVDGAGYVKLPDAKNPTSIIPLVSTTSGGSEVAFSKLYTLQFEESPPWRSRLVQLPQFRGEPMPPLYYGKSTNETLAISNPLPSVGGLVPADYLQIDDSPELRRHPKLDSLVHDLQNDPIALANYVVNEIGSVDTIDQAETSDRLLYLHGVRRSALTTFLEGQGSPVEQCALLVYLLRQAGVPALYVFPTNNAVKMLDFRMSQIVGFHLADQSNTVQAVSVNYPWVLAYLSDQSRWVHIFPWIKDTEIREGLDLYSHLPEAYNSGYKWAVKYLQNDPAIMSLSESDQPRDLFPAFVTKSLLESYPGISIDDIGMQISNRKHHYNSFDDFPRPFSVVSNLVCLESLNTIPNIFDTVTVTSKSRENPSTHVDTGTIKLVDFYNRKFLSRVNGSRLTISLASYDLSKTNQGKFGVGADALSLTNSVPVSDTDLAFELDFTWNKVKPFIFSNSPSTWNGQIGFSDPDSQSSYFYRNDIASWFMTFGRVTDAMLDVHAQEMWSFEQLRRTNSAVAATKLDIFLGTPLYLAGMQWCKRNAEFSARLAKMHKIYQGAEIRGGLMKYQYRGVGMYSPHIDIPFVEAMNFYGVERPDLWRHDVDANKPYSTIQAVNASALEHGAIEDFFGTNAVSTVKVLHLAGWNNVLHITATNYSSSAGAISYDSSFTSAVGMSFTGTSTYAFLPEQNEFFVTKAPISYGSYRGGGLFGILWYGGCWALISANMNGGDGATLNSGTTSPDVHLIKDDQGFHLQADGVGSGGVAGAYTAPDDISQLEGKLGDGSAALDPSRSQAEQQANQLNNGNTSSGDGSPSVQSAADKGLISTFLSWAKNAGEYVYDPVNIISGEFYVNSADLTIRGMMPLSIGRNYSSANLAANQFGVGWKMNYTPFLEISTNESTIYAAELDGSMVVYTQTSDTNRWICLPDKNPNLKNQPTVGVATVTPLSSQLVRYVSGTDTYYSLNTEDGCTRLFRVRDFPVGTLSRQRPYLEKWSDDRGNFYSFEYVEDSSSPEYGQIHRIIASNGNLVIFSYDIYGRVTELSSSDGRRVIYTYDSYGDLIGVQMPDSSEVHYEYLHQTFVHSGISTLYSTHLLTREEKPDGRVWLNTYDDERRVKNQSATVGLDLNPIQNATFFYSNNFSHTNLTNATTGYTLVTDVFNNTYRYDYTNSLITKITDPLNHTIIQNWYDPSETNKAGYFPRSLESVTDKRGLVTFYRYDSNGNITNCVVCGDLTGDGTLDTATNCFLFGANNVLTNLTDPIGDSVQYFYDTTFPRLATSIVQVVAGTPTVTNRFDYIAVTNSFTNGTLIGTNFAAGLLARRIRAYGSSDAATNDWVFNARGLPTFATNYTGSADAPVGFSYVYNERGELVEKDDAAGTRLRFIYDDMGRVTGKETYDGGEAIPLATEYLYYNDNGELTWYDGPRYNPEDYVWRDYDGAGRQTQEIHWRTRAKNDGSGVEAETGDDLYSTTFFEYDAFGNQTSIQDPLGNTIKMRYDPMGQLLERRQFQANSFLPVTTETFGYESGGLVNAYTNTLGGVTLKVYTSNGKLKQQINPDGSVQRWTYYKNGRVHREYLRNGTYFETVYDDFNRLVIRSFSGDAGFVETTALDRRGNAIIKTNASGAVFTTYYDGLDRVKQQIGPPSTYASRQHITTYGYNDSNREVTATNGLGEFSVTVLDALGRSITNALHDGQGACVSSISTSYSVDGHSVTTTLGSGVTAISTTIFTDTAGKELLKQTIPETGVTNFTLKKYDIRENLVFSTDELSQTNFFHFDAVNRLTVQTLPDGTVLTFGYDAAGNMTNRTMPGNLVWSATYDAASRLAFEQLSGPNTSGTNTVNRQFSYAYYNSGPVGLLQTKTDIGRQVTATVAYDSYLRPATNVTVGISSDQNLLLQCQYDRRGLATNILQTTDHAVAITRSFDAYGQITDERVTLDGNLESEFSQTWDEAARRKLLSESSSGNYGLIRYGYRADGLITNVVQNGQIYSFNYLNNGLLSSRTNPWRSETVDRRDGRGRILSRTETVNGTPLFVETMVWRANSTVGSYSATRSGIGAWNDSRTYQYNSRNQLLNEGFGIATGTTATYTYGFDGNHLGVMISSQLSGGLSNGWQAATINSLGQVATELSWQSALTLRSSGSAINASGVAGTLDGAALPGITLRDGRWFADLSLTPGNHMLSVTANNSTGALSSSVSSAFSVSGTNNVSDYYDLAGNTTNRVYASGKTQNLTWDGVGRLTKVVQRDRSTNGFNWYAIYDGLGRRIKTITVPVVANSIQSVGTTSINSLYDPQFEFHELAVAINGFKSWKVMGPDLNGRYGVLNGIGGLEAVILQTTGATTPVLNDYFGNVVAKFVGNQLVWHSTRVAGYGPVSGYQAPVLSSSTPLDETLVWRTRRVDPTGFYWLGARYYDPVAAHFISPDPKGHSSSMDLYSAFGGDPINCVDADGRLAKNALNNWGNTELRMAREQTAFGPGMANAPAEIQRRAEEVMYREQMNGSGNAYTLLQGASSAVGDVDGANQWMEGHYGIDRNSLTLLSPDEADQREATGVAQGVMTIASLLGSLGIPEENPPTVAPPTDTTTPPADTASAPADTAPTAADTAPKPGEADPAPTDKSAASADTASQPSETPTKQPLALGLEDGSRLQGFADERGAWTTMGRDNWFDLVKEALNDPDTAVHFNLDGVDVWGGVQRAAADFGGPTDQELLYIYQNPQTWDNLQFWENGQPVPNPFAK